MSTPLTDSINALTTYANEVTGGSDTTLSDAVHTLASGYGGGGSILGKYVAILSYRFQYAIFDESQDVVVDCSDVEYIDTYGSRNTPDMRNMFCNARRLRSITLQNLNAYSNACDMTEFALKDGIYGAYSDNLESVSIPNCVITPNTASRAFMGRTKLKSVDITFDMSKIAAYSSGYNFRQMFQGCSALEEVRFVPNTILWMNYQIFNVSQVLSDASLASIANGLLEGATQYNSVALLSTPKARCSTLMGNNVDGLFVADENGTMSLADFITNVKGWTLA